MTDLVATARDGFVFGYPLVLMDVTRSVFLNDVSPDGARSITNRFTHRRRFPDASFTAVVSPNADTLYSTAWIDVQTEPVILTVPSSAGRYYLLPLMSAWTDVFASPGTRTTGDGAQTFAISGPGWVGQLPDGIREIRSPTAMVMLIGRTQTKGDADYASAHRFQDALSLTPLSTWNAEDVPSAPPPVDPSIDVTSPPPAQVEAMDPVTFFTRLADLMLANPPSASDQELMDRLATIGLRPGSFQAPPGAIPALKEGIEIGIEQVISGPSRAPTATEGWTMNRDLGSYGTDYLKRAHVALVGLGANLDEDAVYPHTSSDGAGRAFTGDRRYVLRFPPNKQPPARAFWSLTMYDERHYFVANPLSRFAIGDRDPLRLDPDGSLDLWIQHESPGPDREANWLPAPAGPFNLILRIYWPAAAVLDGTWTPPAVKELTEGSPGA